MTKFGDDWLIFEDARVLTSKLWTDGRTSDGRTEGRRRTISDHNSSLSTPCSDELKKLLSEYDSSVDILNYVSNFRHNLSEACELARNNLRSVQSKMKERFDKYTQSRSFQPGDKGLALLPVPDKPLQARYFSPFTIKEKFSDFN